MKDLIALDIETGPETDDRLGLVEPEFKAPANWKDPEKIAAAIAEKREAWIAEAALSPMTGRILAAGWGSPDTGWNVAGVGITDSDNPEPTTERDVIEDVFGLCGKAQAGAFRIVGFNLGGFDLPFLVRRAMILGVRVPFAMRPNGQSRFFWPPCFIDLQQIWGCGDYRPHGSLNDICKLMGIGEKSGSGADFARLWLNPKTQHDAVKYLMRDLELTYKLAERLIA